MSGPRIQPVAPTSSDAAGGGATTAIRLAFISGGYPVWPLLAGLQQGLFERAGLTVEAVMTGSSAAQVAGLREGRFDIGLQLADHVLRAGAEGCAMVVLGAQSHPPDVALMAAPGTETIDDLRGRPVAVDGARSGYALLLRRLLRSRGFADDEIVFVEVGGTTERADALRDGRVQAAFVNPPLDHALVASGFVRLAGTRECFPDYPGPVVACRRDWASAHPEVAAAFRDAWRLAWDWLLDPANEVQAVALACGRFDVTPAAASRVLGALRSLGRPSIDATGLEVVHALLVEGGVAASALPSPASVVWRGRS